MPDCSRAAALAATVAETVPLWASRCIRPLKLVVTVSQTRARLRSVALLGSSDTSSHASARLTFSMEVYGSRGVPAVSPGGVQGGRAVPRGLRAPRLARLVGPLQAAPLTPHPASCEESRPPVVAGLPVVKAREASRIYLRARPAGERPLCTSRRRRAPAAAAAAAWSESKSPSEMVTSSNRKSGCRGGLREGEPARAQIYWRPSPSGWPSVRPLRPRPPRPRVGPASGRRPSSGLSLSDTRPLKEAPLPRAGRRLPPRAAAGPPPRAAVGTRMALRVGAGAPVQLPEERVQSRGQRPHKGAVTLKKESRSRLGGGRADSTYRPTGLRRSLSPPRIGCSAGAAPAPPARQRTHHRQGRRWQEAHPQAGPGC